MDIIVCIKQVPGSTKVKINPETGTLIRDSVDAVINPFDEYAVEEAVRIRENHGGSVKILSMGPPQAENAIRSAIAMGADEGYLACDRAFAGSDTWATSYTLSSAIKSMGKFDLVICGKQAIDGDTAQVGPGVAEMLDIPFISWVKKVQKIEGDKITAQRMMEDGYDVVEAPLPSLITVVKDINEPRMASLKGKMKARKAQITTIDAETLKTNASDTGLNGSPTQVLRSFVPERKTGGEKISGEPSELVEKISSTILDLGIIK